MFLSYHAKKGLKTMGIDSSVQLFINRTRRFWDICNRLSLRTHHLDSTSKFRQNYATLKLGLYGQGCGLYGQGCAYITAETHHGIKTKIRSLKETKVLDIFSRRTAKLNRSDFLKMQTFCPSFFEPGLMSKYTCTGGVQRMTLSNNKFQSYCKRSLSHRSYRCVRHYTAGRDHSLPIIYLFTKEECTLCDLAKEVLRPYRHRFTLQEVDITLPENADWYEKYKYDIPVFHMYEDFLFMHKVDLDILEQALTQHEDKGK